MTFLLGLAIAVITFLIAEGLFRLLEWSGTAPRPVLHLHHHHGLKRPHLHSGS